MKLEVGQTYRINHRRGKGQFKGKCLSFSEEWGRFQIVSGKAKYISSEDRKKGEEVTVRLSFCDFETITIPDEEAQDE